MRTICEYCPTRKQNQCPYILSNKERDCLDVQTYDDGYEQAVNDAVEYIKAHVDKGLVIYHEETWTSLDKFCDLMTKGLYKNIE